MFPSHNQEIDSRLSFADWFAIIGIVIWGTFQLVHSGAWFSDEFRAATITLKNIAAAVFISANAVVFVYRYTHQVRYGKMRLGVLISYGLFVAVALIPMFFNTRSSNFLLVIMYFLWGLYAYVLASGMLRSGRAWTTFLKVTNRVTTAVLLMGVIFAFTTGEFTAQGLQTRLTFGFFVVQYGYALCVVSTTALALAGLTKSRLTRKFYYLQIAICGILMMLAVSRTSVVFLMALLLTFWVSKSDLALGWGLLLTLAAVIGVGLAFDVMGYDKVDELSSGRLSLYEYELGTHLIDRPADEWLLGSSRFLQSENTNVIDTASHSARYSRNQTDNAYLSMLLSHGIFGLCFFAAPLLLLAWTLRLRMLGPPSPATEMSRLGLAVWVAVAMASLTESTLPSLGGILPIYMPLFWAPVLDINWGIVSYAKNRIAPRTASFVQQGI